MTVQFLLQLFTHVVELLHLLAQLLDLVLQPLGLGLDLRGLRAVGRLQGVEVSWMLCSICL